MAKWKAAAALGLLVVALAAGMYLSGWLLTRLLLKVDVPVEPTTYWRYYDALDHPRVQPYAAKIKAAGAIGLGLPLLAWAFLLVPLLKPRQQALHGDARFADMADLKKAKLLTKTPESIVLGKFKNHYIYLGGPQHVIAIAPTRSGKTTSIAFPVLLSYEHSIVVLDLKGELRKGSSGWRSQELGQRVYVWAPYDEAGRTHRFNPMSALIELSPDKRIAEIQTIAAILYPDEPGKDPFWVAQARSAFLGFAGYLFENWDDLIAMKMPGMDEQGNYIDARPDPQRHPHFPSFERILMLSAGDGSGMKTFLGNLRQRKFISPQTRTIFSNLAGLAEDTLSSIIATMQAPLQQFLSPVLAAATNATDFDISSFRRVPTTLYVDIPTQKLDESAKLLNIFFSTVIGANLGKQLGEEPDLKYQLLMLMDEFTAMGRVDVWAKRISISASYGVRDLCIIQSRAQLRATYGDHDAQNFITNHGAQAVFTPREQSDANEYSEMLGYRTIRKKHRTYSSGSSGGGTSYHYTEERRALFLPQEIKELPMDDMLIFYEGCRPIRCKKNWFFKDKLFSERANRPPVQIAPIAQRLQEQAQARTQANAQAGQRPA